MEVHGHAVGADGLGRQRPALVPNERGLDRAQELGLGAIAIFGSVTDRLRFFCAKVSVAEHHGVWIGLSDQVGITTRHLIHPDRVEGGRVWATDDTGRQRTFSVHRITGATIEA